MMFSMWFDYPVISDLKNAKSM